MEPVRAWVLLKGSAALLEYSSLRERPLRIPGNLPEMLIGILKVPGIAAPKRVAGWLDDPCPRAHCLFHHRIHFVPGGNIMPEGKLSRSRRAEWEPGIMRKACAWPECELESCLQVAAASAYGFPPQHSL